MTAAEVKHGSGAAPSDEAAGFTPVTFKEFSEHVTKQFDEDQYADAILLVQREKKCTLSFLKSNLSVDEETAEAMIFRMEQDGVISEPNDLGGRAIFD
ncbi:Ftsk gamma domain protein [compost metagenome]